jgi:DNA sulfur modification protein DndD
MILETLVLHNFGLYAGRQVINLSPTSENKPIILFGGLNGAGKTTILDALQLALYGKLAKTSARQGKAYEEYLLECIHSNSAASEGASVELTFSHRSAGKTHRFTVNRSWSARQKKVKESTIVIRDGHKDEALTMNWNQYIDGILPSKIAQLFFFDGEKITELAELGSTRAFLSTSIHSLLGLDIISQLDNDLDTLMKREKDSVQENFGKLAIAAAQEEVDILKREHERLVLECGGLKNGLDRACNKTNSLESKFERSGGNIYLRQKEIEIKKSESIKNLSSLDDTLRSNAEGELPLLLVEDLLEQVVVQGELELKKQKIESTIEVIDKRDQESLNFIKGVSNSNDVMQKLVSFFANDVKERRHEQASIKSYLNLDKKTLDDVRIVCGGLDETKIKAEEMVIGRVELVDSIENYDRMLEGISDDNQLGILIKELDESRRDVLKLESKYNLLKEQKVRVFQAIEDKDSKLQAVIEKAVSHELNNERAIRSVKWGGKVKTILGTYSKELIKVQVKRLEGLVYECYIQLLRKEKLIKSVTIDPDTFELNLINENSGILPFSRLSAGERQLLAVAMHWGLARASGKPIPCIIDTPLGRLDSKHRKNLIQNYFPYASHQVLLLSTDEEINDGRRAALSPHIGRLYHLDYDDSKQRTSVKNGYFDMELV